MNPKSMLDIRAYVCPLTYVKTRIALDRLAPGEALEVWLIEGEPLSNVPRSAEEDGHRVLLQEPLPTGARGDWRLVIEKGVGAS